MLNKPRESMNIVVVGHVDHGKSTLIGRLLFDTDALSPGAIKKVQGICQEKGKPFEYAFLLDALEEEQKQGITIDTTRISFATHQRDYVIIDAPGHKEFLKNMISGAASAEAALLLIDAQEGIREQSKRHGYILSLLGIKNVYVLVNKMDLVDYDRDKFAQIKEEMGSFLNALGVYPLKYIPISAFQGENITAHSAKMPWYDGEPVLKALDFFEQGRDLEDRPLRLPIQDVYKFDSRRIIVGRIESGRLHVGDSIVISPGNKKTRVKTIEHWQPKDQKDEVTAGMSVGITVEDEFFNSNGEIITHTDTLPQTAQSFKASVFWLGKKPLVAGKRYKLKLSAQEVECCIQRINKVIDAATLGRLEDAPAVHLNDVAEVVIETKRPVAFDDFKDNQHTGRFVLVDGYDVSGGGIISGLAGEQISTESQNRVIENYLVTRQEREAREKQKGKVIWLSGPRESLRNEIAIKAERRLFDLGKKVYYLSNNNWNITETEHVNLMAQTARVLADSGIIAIVAFEADAKDFVRCIIPQEDLHETIISDDEQMVAEDKIEEIVKLAIG